MPYHWSDEYGARLGVMPRSGGPADLRWYEIEPCYVFHPWNAYETADGRIVLDVARYPELWRQNSGHFDTASAHRFTLDPKSGNVKEERLDERPIEFPRIDDRLDGSRHRYGYTVAAVGGANEGFRGLLKYDFEKGGAVEHDFGPGRATGEACSWRRQGDEGYVLSFHDEATTTSSDPRRADSRPSRRGPAAARALRLHGNWGDR
jgi:carotenoid cleavage dioxygenase